MPLQPCGHEIIAGVPYINGKRAEPCDCQARGRGDCTLGGVLLPYRCPECHAHLGRSGICLNACHLTAGQLRRFEASLRLTTQPITWEERDDQ